MSKKTFLKELNNPAEDKSNINTEGSVTTTASTGPGTITVGNPPGVPTTPTKA